MRKLPVATVAATLFLSSLLAGSNQGPASNRRNAVPTTTADWVEPDFPFFSSVVDARRAGAEFPTDNLTPRGVVLRVAPDVWAAFDIDLLRVAAVWRGTGLTPVALAPGSYHHPDKKTPGGQSPLPEPVGTVWLANGIYPGWQAGESVSLADPREPAPSPEEVGRGPLDEELGRFRAIRQVRDGVVLEYSAGGVDVQEHMTATGRTFVRQFRVGASSHTLSLVVGICSNVFPMIVGNSANLTLDKVAPQQRPSNVVWTVRIPPHAQPVEFGVALATAPEGAVGPLAPIPSDAPSKRWPQDVTTTVTQSVVRSAYEVDDVGLPVENPWHRLVRPGDVQFLRDGTAALVTLDGDVWLARGMGQASGGVHWRRFASGLHEPLTLAIRDEQIYVFDRNGIWRLRDTNGDGEADVHELFSNAFAQTADLREFPSTIRLAPGGEFVIAKGGQEAATFGKHNGSVLRVSADGRRATVLGYGFRQPNIGVNIRTGLVTASDQQGNYIPSTPLHIVTDAQFYGFLSDKKPREVYPAPIADPLTWIPHAANASSMSQVWLFGARMGPLNDGLVYIGFNNPELFRILPNNRSPKPQAAVVSITRAFDFPPLNGSVNPVDGQLYIAGFQILGWGTTATRLAGLGRVRYTGEPSSIPREVVPMAQGVLLRFDVPLDQTKAVDPDSYSLATWHYTRTYQYGSPQLKADGTPGIDRLPTSSAYLSKDGKSVFIGVPGMTPVMQLGIGWSLATRAGQTFQDTAYTTPYELPRFNPSAEGFGDVRVNLSARHAAVKADAPASAVEGKRLYQAYGCIACHAVDNTSLTKLGPTWKGLYGSQRAFAGGVVRTVADDVYIRQSILDPAAQIVEGYERGEVSMPSYAGVLTDSQIESIVLFIKSLGGNR